MKPCCKNQCLRKLSPSYSTLNFEPCLEILHSARKQCDTSSNSRLHISHYSLGLYGADHIICRIAFCNAFDITLYRLKRLIKEVKFGMMHMSTNSKEFNSLSAISENTTKAVVDLLAKNNIRLNQDMEVNIALPNTIPIGKCRSWLTQYFKTTGDNDPTETEIHVDYVELKEIYAEYSADMKAYFNDTGKRILSYARFCWLLHAAFSHVKIRDYRSVSNNIAI
mmetsp:Transcript_9411/g.14064  ORF Transcript_9411/g.14064 Transcript_9411/m.14064 type:complete len:223 (-) Transcript_9411:502-1170(-)